MYTIWPKDCGHLTIKPICAWKTTSSRFRPLSCYNNLHTFGKAFRSCDVAVGICSFSHKSITKIRVVFLQTKRPGVQLTIQFILKVLIWVEVRVLCRTLEFFQSTLGNPCIHGPAKTCLNPLLPINANCNVAVYIDFQYHCVPLNI